MTTLVAPPGRVLIVAGSDSGGGAGIQADIKAVLALGGYAATAITALTAQNTQGVFGIHAVPTGFIQQQMELVLDDIGADCIKVGMLGTAEIIDAVADVIERPAYRHIPVVLDPVMVAKGGHPLLEAEAVATLKRRLLLVADILTPNIPEAELLTGMTIRDLDAMTHAGEMLRTLGPTAVLLKGGHLMGRHVRDLYATEDGDEVFEAERVDTHNTHGTGCTLSSAIATGVAQGLEMRAAVARARAYVHEAIRTAPDLGKGHGPLNHGHTVRPDPL